MTSNTLTVHSNTQGEASALGAPVCCPHGAKHPVQGSSESPRPGMWEMELRESGGKKRKQAF